MQAHHEKVSSHEGRIRDLVSQLERKESYMQTVMRRHADDLKEKEQKLQKSVIQKGTAAVCERLQDRFVVHTWTCVAAWKRQTPARGRVTREWRW